jgi:hypothetical protein
MRLRLIIAILSATSFLATAGDNAPQMTEISQKAAKPGEVVTVSGLGLSPKNVDEIYLTDHRFDMRVKVLDQKETAIQFRVPPFAKPGRMQLLFLTKGAEPKLLEQPVYLLIEDPNAEVIAKAAPEPVKTDVTQAEPAKPAETKSVEAKPEQGKIESPKEQTKIEQTKVEQTKVEQTSIDHAKPLLAKPDPRQPKL